MNTVKVASQRIIYAVAAFAMVVAIILPAIASAAQVTVRSVELSSSSVSASNVTYGVNFTPVADAGAFVVYFCDNSPLIGQACDAPADFTSAGVTTPTSGFSINSSTATRVVVAGPLTGGTPASVSIAGITNPSAAGALYARIVTYDTAANAAAASATDLGTGSEDQGGVAISITPTIGVSGTVMETITFCVSKVVIDDACETTEAPVVRLGEVVGSTVALTPGTISTDSIWTQISTNAAGGAVIRLKSNATDCGGLLRAGAAAGVCDIEPALDDGIDAGANEAKFGVRTTTAAPASGVNNTSGSLVPAAGSFYNNDTYALNFVDQNTAGVTSTFGDPFLETAGEPVSGQNMQIIFGATASNNTPAGSYSADLSLIAVGKF